MNPYTARQTETTRLTWEQIVQHECVHRNAPLHCAYHDAPAQELMQPPVPVKEESSYE